MVVAFTLLFSKQISYSIFKAALMKISYRKKCGEYVLGLWIIFVPLPSPHKLFVNLCYLWASVLLSQLSFVMRCWQAIFISLLREPFLLLHRCAAAQWARLCRNHPSSFLEGGFCFEKKLQALVAAPGTWRFLTSCFAAGIPELSAGSWRGSGFPFQASRHINQCLHTQQYPPLSM